MTALVNGQLSNLSSVGARLVRQFPETFNKLMAAVAVLSVPYTLWRASGNPTAGAFPAVGKANGRACSEATTGAWQYNNATSPNTLYAQLANAYAASSSIDGSLILCDRLADVLLAHNEATGNITGCDGTARLDTGQGGQIITEIGQSLGGASNTFELDYDDELGVSQTTPTITTTANRTPEMSVNGELWQLLATGSKGVRKVTKVTQHGANATGQFTAAIVRPILICPIQSQTVLTVSTLETYLASVIKPSSCLFWMYQPGQTTVARFQGLMTTMELSPA